MERGRDAPLVTVTCQKWHCVSLSASCVSQEKKANQSLCQELAAEREKVARAEEKLVQGASVEAALQVMYMACTHAGMHQPNTCTPQACINPTRVHRRHASTQHVYTAGIGTPSSVGYTQPLLYHGHAVHVHMYVHVYMPTQILICAGALKCICAMCVMLIFCHLCRRLRTV